jgi:hypothetical protein
VVAVAEYTVHTMEIMLSIATCSTALASSPGLLIGGREGLVSTACACAVIIQILNNPITYGYLPFDLNFRAQRTMYLEMASLDSSIFERDFEIARETLPRRLTKASE